MKKQTKTTTTVTVRELTAEQKATARQQGWESVKQQIVEVVARYEQAFEKARTDFTGRFAVNPADAIAWSAQTVVESQTRYVEALNLQKALIEKTDEVTVLGTDHLALALELLNTWRTEETDKFVRNFNIARSTCPWQNAVDNAKTTATRDALVGFNSVFGEFRALLMFTDKNCEKVYAQVLDAQEQTAA